LLFVEDEIINKMIDDRHFKPIAIFEGWGFDRETLWPVETRCATLAI